MKLYYWQNHAFKLIRLADQWKSCQFSASCRWIVNLLCIWCLILAEKIWACIWSMTLFSDRGLVSSQLVWLQWGCKQPVLLVPCHHKLRRQVRWRSMFDLYDMLLICSAFLSFVFLISGLEGWPVARCERVKHPHIKTASCDRSSQKRSAFMSSRGSSSVLADRSVNSSWLHCYLPAYLCH